VGKEGVASLGSPVGLKAGDRRFQWSRYAAGDPLGMREDCLPSGCYSSSQGRYAVRPGWLTTEVGTEWGAAGGPLGTCWRPPLTPGPSVRSGSQGFGSYLCIGVKKHPHGRGVRSVRSPPLADQGGSLTTRC